MLNLTLIVPSINEFIVVRFSVSETEASLFVTVEMLAYILFGLVWGAVSDVKGKRKRLIVIGYLGAAVCYSIMIVTPDLLSLLGVRFIQGIFSVMAWSLLMTIGLDIARAGTYGKTMGIIGMGLMLGVSVGAPVGGVLADYGMFFPIYAAAAVSLIGAILTLMLLKESALDTQSKPESLGDAMRTIIKEPKLAAPCIYSFLERYSAGYFVFLFPLMLQDLLVAPPSARGFYLAAFLFPFVLLQYPFGRLVDRYGRARFLIFGGVAYGALFMVIGIATDFLLPLMIACGTLAALLFPACLALLGDLSPSGERGTFMGAFNLFGSMGFAAGPFLSATIADVYGYRNSFLTGGIILLIMVFGTIPILRKIPYRGKIE
jgi:DHA1 family tetracycline resistance protein-like MFS transporter